MGRGHPAHEGSATVRSRDPPDHPEAPGDKEMWNDFPTFFSIPDFLKTGNRMCPVCRDMVTPGKIPVQVASARGCSICMECLYTWRALVREYSPQTLDRCLKCQGFMVEADREKDRVYQTWEARGYAAYLRDAPQGARTRWESRTQVRPPQAQCRASAGDPQAPPLR